MSALVSSAEGAFSLTLRLSDEDVARVAAAIIAQTARLVPGWLPERPLTPGEAADFLGVSENTLRRWKKDGALVPFSHGQTILYTPDQIADFLTSGAHQE